MHAFLTAPTTLLDRLFFARVPIDATGVSIEYGEFAAGVSIDVIRRAAESHLLLLSTPRQANPLLTWAQLTERLQALGFERQARDELTVGGARFVSFLSKGRHRPWTRLSAGTDAIDAWLRMGEPNVLGVLGLPTSAISSEAIERMTNAIARATAETLYPLGKVVDEFASEAAKAVDTQIAQAMQAAADLEHENEQIADAASQRATTQARDYVLAQPAYPSAEIHRVLGGSADSQNKNDMAKRLRQGGQLLGIWNGREFRHPRFQFTPTGQLDPRFAELLAVLPTQAEDRTGWRRAFWFYFPNELLEDREPAAVWAVDPNVVIEAAREEFVEDTDDDA